MLGAPALAVDASASVLVSARAGTKLEMRLISRFSNRWEESMRWCSANCRSAPVISYAT